MIQVKQGMLAHGGTERLIDWRNRLIKDEPGRSVSTLSSGEDITERNGLISSIEHLLGSLLDDSDT